MILSESEVQRCLDLVKAAFPRFGEWEHNNEVNEEYMGFSVWGRFVVQPDEALSRRFFVTFDIYEANWHGHLSVGQHCYFWSSADFGDAVLVDTDACATLDAAISALKAETAALFSAFLSSPSQ